MNCCRNALTHLILFISTLTFSFEYKKQKKNYEIRFLKTKNDLPIIYSQSGFHSFKQNLLKTLVIYDDL